MRSVYDLIPPLAEQSPYHPAAAWIESVPWDGRSRYQEFIDSIEYENKEERDYAHVVMRRWLAQVVDGAFNYTDPCQKGLIPVLVGAQGIGKTRWIASLAPDEFVSVGVTLSLGTQSSARDSIMAATRALIVELGELEHTFRKADQGMLKNYATRKWDEYRPPYGRVVLRYPRLTSAISSVNTAGFLMDETGTRRFVPILVLKCHPLAVDFMQQLFAEVRTWQIEPWLSESEEQSRILREDDFTSSNDVEDALSTYFIPLFNKPRDPDKVVPLSFRDIASMLHFSSYPRNASIVQAWLAKYGYKRHSKYGNKHKCWLLPVQDEEWRKHEKGTLIRRSGGGG